MERISLRNCHYIYYYMRFYWVISLRCCPNYYQNRALLLSLSTRKRLDKSYHPITLLVLPDCFSRKAKRSTVPNDQMVLFGQDPIWMIGIPTMMEGFDSRFKHGAIKSN